MLRDGFCLIDRFNANFLSLLRATYATKTVNWCAVLFILFNVVMNVVSIKIKDGIEIVQIVYQF